MVVLCASYLISVRTWVQYLAPLREKQKRKTFNEMKKMNKQIYEIIKTAKLNKACS
jgi:hypothetical protein